MIFENLINSMKTATENNLFDTNNPNLKTLKLYLFKRSQQFCPQTWKGHSSWLEYYAYLTQPDTVTH